MSESLFYLLGSILSRALSFIMLPLYSHCLTPAEYGTVELAELATSVVGMVFGMNVFGAAMTRVYQDCKTKQDQNRVVSTAILADLMIGALAVSLAIVLATPLSHAVFKSTEYVNLLTATFVSMFFATTVEVCLVNVRLKRQARRFLTYSLVSLLITVALNVVFLIVMRAGVWGFVMSKLVVTSVGGLILLVTTLRTTGIQFDIEACRRLATFGTPLILANVSLFFVHFGDRFFLGRLTGLAEVGSYSLAYKFGMLITTFVGEPFHRAWSVRYCTVLKDPGATEKLRSVSKVFAGCLLTGALGIALFSRDVITMMAPRSYAAACVVIPLIVLGYLLRDFADFFRNFLFVANRSSVVSGITVSTGILNCMLNIIFISSWGTIGAAVATLGTWLCYWAVIYGVSQRQAGIQFPLGTYVLQLAMCTSAYLASTAISSSSVITRVGIKGAMFLVCAATMFRYGGLDASERRRLVVMVRGPIDTFRNRYMGQVPAAQLASNMVDL